MTDQKQPLRRPRHEQIAEALEEEIRQRSRPGDRLETERALAERFSTSTLTVREALSRLAQQGLVTRKHGSGTYVIDPYANRHIGIVTAFDITAPHAGGFFLSVARWLQGYFQGRGWATRLYVGGSPPEGAFDPREEPESFTLLAEDCRQGRLHGAVSLSTPGRLRWMDTLEEHGVPVVGDSTVLRYTVQAHYADLLEKGLHCLAEAGCRGVGVLRWGLGLKAIEQGMERYGLRFRADWVQDTRHPTLPGAGYQAMARLLATAGPELDGVLICDEQLFGTATMAIMQAGRRVPGDLRVATHASRGSWLFRPFPVHLLLCEPEVVGAALAEAAEKVYKDPKAPAFQVRVPFRCELVQESFEMPDHASLGASAAP
jgi:DNA-binding LacI/PurR family transcriptional regulator